MKYFKNTELAKLYNISEKSVRNWIDAAKQNKLDIQLYKDNDREYIADISKNIVLIEQLVQKGKKYKNSRGHKVVTPSTEFYKIFNAKEIFDIISAIDTYNEIPCQYGYFNGGATQWDLYVQKLAKEKTPNLLTNTIELLSINTAYLDMLTEKHTQVNIIDLGVGNCYPVRALLEHFVTTGRLGRYIGIDTSRDMLNIAEHNIKDWFDGKIHFEGYVRDINYDRFADILAQDSFNRDTSTLNLALYLGSTIANFRKVDYSLRTIRESMGKHDLLAFSMKLDTENSRRYFDFDTSPENPILLSKQDKFMLDLLNIDESLYDVEQFFDEKKMARRIQVRLKVAISIEFQLDDQPKVVDFNKGEIILLWQHKHQNTLKTIQQFDNNDFELLQATLSNDQECIFTISKIKENTVSAS